MVMFNWGYGDRIRALGFTALKNRYPEAYGAIENELKITSLMQ
jgi:hypothetical protein